MTGFTLCRYTVSWFVSVSVYYDWVNPMSVYRVLGDKAKTVYTVSWFVSVSVYYDWVNPMSVYRVLVCPCVSIPCLGEVASLISSCK